LTIFRFDVIFLTTHGSQRHNFGFRSLALALFFFAAPMHQAKGQDESVPPEATPADPATETSSESKPEVPLPVTRVPDATPTGSEVEPPASATTGLGTLGGPTTLDGEKETTKGTDPDTANSQPPQELEHDETKWSAGGVLGFSRRIDAVQRSERLSYGLNIARKGEEHSKLTASVAISQDGLFRDDPVWDAVTWSWMLPHPSADPNDVALSYSGALIEPDKVHIQGFVLNSALAATQTIYKQDAMTIAGKAAIFWLATEYRQSLMGEEYTHFGLGQSLLFAYEFQEFQFALTVGADQGYRANTVRLAYSHAQSIEYALGEGLTVGIAHSLGHSMFDPALRDPRPRFLLGDAEDSVVSATLSYFM
jgi:hypothetical protein